MKENICQKKELFLPFSWEERRPCLLDGFFYIPHAYEKHAEEKRLSWEEVFGNRHPVSVEFCSGNGQWIAARAEENPSRNWVAVERRFDRARKTWKRAGRQGLSNLFVVCAEASLFIRFYAPLRSFASIYVNFPDPWPKTRHAKHRLIQAPFLEGLAAVSQEGAESSFVSDDVPYLEQMEAALNGSPHWELVSHLPMEESYGESFFKSLWESKGRIIYQIQARTRL